MKSSVKKSLLKGLLVLILLGLAAGGIYLKRVADYQRAVREITVPALALEEVPDGRYIGTCDVDFIRARVEVAVEKGSITEIRILEHKNGRGLAAERVTEDIIARQSLQVDAVSGATNSSTVLKKAVANALEGACP